MEVSGKDRRAALDQGPIEGHLARRHRRPGRCRPWSGGASPARSRASSADHAYFLGDQQDGVYFKRLAVPPWQIGAWELPTRPTKTKDPRARGFEGESVEVDAIPAQLLRAIVRDAIEQHIEPGRCASPGSPSSPSATSSPA